MQQRKMEFEVVFAGVPLDSRVEGDYQVTRFRVLRVFKGRAAPTQEARERIVFGDSTQYATERSTWSLPGWRMNRRRPTNVTR